MIELGPAGIAIAFAAGFVSFTSPCVLPLVPGYLSFVSGVGFDELGDRPRRVTASTAAFIVGFTSMFVGLGAGAAFFGNFLLENRRPLEIAAGIFIILAAVTFLGFPLPRLLAAERRLYLGARGGGPAASYLTGVTFAIGWTPCVGPTLAAILTLSAGGPGAAEGAILLTVYSLGLGLPFLAFGLLFTRALGLVRWLRGHWRRSAHDIRRRAVQDRRSLPSRSARRPRASRLDSPGSAVRASGLPIPLRAVRAERRSLGG